MAKRVHFNYLKLLLLLSILFIIVTRIYGVDHRELWGDEIFSIQHAKPSLNFSELISGLAGERTNPLLYQTSLWVPLDETIW